MREAIVCLVAFFYSVAIILLSFRLGVQSESSRCEYKTEYMQEELENCKMRERFNIR